MLRDELYARVEVLKIAERITGVNGNESVSEVAHKLWNFALPEGQQIEKGDCGCNNKTASEAKPSLAVIPFSWVRNQAGNNYKLFVMDFVFAEVEVSKADDKPAALLKREGLDTRVFIAADGESRAPIHEALEDANASLLQWLNANTEMVRDWLELKAKTKAAA